MTVLSRSIDVFIKRTLSDAARSAALVAYAERDVQRLIAEGRAPARYEVWVDGRRGADPLSVRPDGVLVYKFNLLGQIVEFALAELKRMSPYGPPKSAQNRSGAGHYRDKFWVGVNQRLVKAENFKRDLVPPNAEIVILNSQPYSRKVDTRYVGYDYLNFASGEIQLFSKTARAVRRVFGGVVDAKRVYTMKFDGQYVLQGTEKAGKPVESPALIIRPKGVAPR